MSLMKHLVKLSQSYRSAEPSDRGGGRVYSVAQERLVTCCNGRRGSRASGWTLVITRYPYSLFQKRFDRVDEDGHLATAVSHVD